MNLNLATIYQWQMEYRNGTGTRTSLLNRYENGREQSSKSVDPLSVIRVSLLPTLPILPQHDVYIDHQAGEFFVKWFGRAIIKRGGLSHYLNCIQTNRYRMWVHTDGRVWITDPNKEIYL